MAKRLLEKKCTIDAFISSPALRAKTTATLFAKEYGVLSDEIIFIDALYHAPAEVFFEVIKKIPEEIKNVAIFSHNPGITYFLNQLINNSRIDDMPTCGIFAVSITGSWQNFSNEKKQFLFFDWPKNE